MAERVADATGYGRLRAFLETEELTERRLTAEWLAGRLSIPLRSCGALLDQLASEGVVHRHTRVGEAPWFDVVPPSPRTGFRRFVLGLVVLVLCAVVVGAGVMLHHIFWFVFGLTVGFMMAFAWLDWELNTRS